MENRKVVRPLLNFMFEPWFWFQVQRGDKNVGRSKVASSDVRNKSHMGIFEVLMKEREDPQCCFEVYLYGVSSRQYVSTIGTDFNLRHGPISQVQIGSKS